MCQLSSAKSSSTDNKFYFLGTIHKRYVQTYIGSFHAISSVVALIFGNYLFLQYIILGHDMSSLSTIPTIFHISTLLSGLTLLPFWNKVQSWQLSTTSIEEKGLTAQQMQNFNRGRGVLCMIISATYPLIYRHASDDVLQNVLLSRMVGGIVAILSLCQYTLIRDHGKALFIIYGGSMLGYSLHLLWSGSLYLLREDYPYAINFLEKEAVFVVCCVEFGFLCYYLLSRKLVTKEFVQEACKRYHPSLFFIFITRLMVSDRWWSHLPISLSLVMFLNSLLAGLFLTKMTKSLLARDSSSQKEVAASKNNDDY